MKNYKIKTRATSELKKWSPPTLVLVHPESMSVDGKQFFRNSETRTVRGPS